MLFLSFSILLTSISRRNIVFQFSHTTTATNPAACLRKIGLCVFCHCQVVVLSHYSSLLWSFWRNGFFSITKKKLTSVFVLIEPQETVTTVDEWTVKWKTAHSGFYMLSQVTKLRFRSTSTVTVVAQYYDESASVSQPKKHLARRWRRVLGCEQVIHFTVGRPLGYPRMTCSYCPK